MKLIGKYAMCEVQYVNNKTILPPSMLQPYAIVVFLVFSPLLAHVYCLSARFSLMAYVVIIKNQI